MKLIENVLFIEFQEMVDCGVSVDTLKQAKMRNFATISFIDDPSDNRKVLIDFEKLGTSYKDKVIARFGNPYHFMARQPIKQMVQWDNEANKYYLSYTFDGNKKLSAEHVKKYTLAASWLNMLVSVNKDKKALKTLLKLTIDEFNTHVCDLIKKEEIDLPTTWRRLFAKRKEYEADGYNSLIDWRFGNKLAAKIKDELSESVLQEMIAHHNNFDDVFIAQQYNVWAIKNEYKTIDSATVGVHRRKSDFFLTMQRDGNAELNRKYIKQVKGFRPTFPLAFVESDDNHLDLLFLDPEASATGNKYYNRYKAIVVIDSYNDYVLGYAYTLNNVTVDLVRAAYMNAMYYLRSITGAWHLPHETKTDNFGIESLKPFYKGMGKYIETPVGSKHRGYIEQFFGSAHWKRCMKVGANNYTGNNITAKNRGVNIDSLKITKNTKDERPMIGDEAAHQIENFFHRLRHMPQNNGKSKHAEWLEAWENVPAESKRPITDEQFLLTFGIEHNYRGEGIRISNRGIEPQINGTKYSYDLEQYDPSHIGKSVTLLYDPFDMSRILVTDYDKVRILAHDARLHSRALEDAEVGSRTFLQAVYAEKNETVQNSANRMERRKEVLSSAAIDVETVLQAGILVKEISHNANELQMQRMISGTSGPEKEFDPFEQL